MSGRAMQMTRAVRFVLYACLVSWGMPAEAEVLHPWHRESAGILGRVFFDHDGNGSWSEGDEGLAGVRLITDTGLRIVTDKEGRFHLFLMIAGYEIFDSHVIRVDDYSLPFGTTCVSSLQRLIHLRPMEIQRVDFALRPPASEPAMTQSLKQSKEQSLEIQAADPVAGTISAFVGGINREGCQVWIDGKRYGSKKISRFTHRVILRPGVNPYLVTLHCDDGHLEFVIAETHWIKRKNGGDLIVPGKLTTLAVCQAPPEGGIRYAPYADISCRLDQDVELRIEPSELIGNSTQNRIQTNRLSLNPGHNGFVFKLYSGKAGWRQEVISWNVSNVRWTAAFIGSTVWSRDASKDILAWKTRGFFQLELPYDLDILGGIGLYGDQKKMPGNTQSSDEINPATDIGDILHPARNPWRHEREPDPELNPIVTGDRAMILDHNPSDSRYFLSVRRQSSHLGWGGFEINQGIDAETGVYRRASFGAHASIRPFEQLSLESDLPLDFKMEGFISPQRSDGQDIISREQSHPGPVTTFPAHEEFLTTGGTLYFLANRWVVEGSEFIQIQIRDDLTGLVLNRKILKRNLDYQLDWTSGRLLLTSPIEFDSELGGFSYHSMSAGSKNTILVVDYEYVRIDDTSQTQNLAGGRVAINADLFQDVRLETSLQTVHEMGAEYYRLTKSEARLRFTDNSFLRMAYSRNQGKTVTPRYSVDGGLSFDQAPTTQSNGAEAYETELSLEFDALRSRMIFRRFLEGYSDTHMYAVGDMTQLFAILEAEPWLRLRLGMRASHTQWGPENSWDAGQLSQGSLWFKIPVNEKLQLALQSTMDQAQGAILGDGKRLMSGISLGYQAGTNLMVTAAHQHALLKSGSGWASSDRTMSCLGARAKLSPNQEIDLKTGWGPKLGHQLGISFAQKDQDGKTMFANTTFSLDRPPMGDASSLTAGQSVPLDNGWLLSTANSIGMDGYAAASNQHTKVEIPLSSSWRIGIHYTRSELIDPSDETNRNQLRLGPFFDRRIWTLNHPGRRDSLHTRLSYITPSIALSGSGEYRQDEHLPLVEENVNAQSELQDHRQTVFTMAASWTVMDQLTLGGRLAWAETFGREHADPGPGVGEGRFLESSLGLIYRPQTLDWLRLWMRINIGEGQRPVWSRLYPTGFHMSHWRQGVLGVLLQPSRYFQPTLVVSPCFYEFAYTGGQIKINEPIPDLFVFRGMLRVGTQLYMGFGVSSEMRFDYGNWDLDTTPRIEQLGFRTGYALETFYELTGSSTAGLRIGVGYSFSDLPDPVELTDLRDSNKGFFVRLEGVL